MHSETHPSLSIVIPAYNEEENIDGLLTELSATLAHLDDERPWEVLVIDDASTDATAARAATHDGVRVVAHPYNIGNGAAVKTGIRHARGDIVLLMDGDGQHDPAAIPELLTALDTHDMAVGARTSGTDASAVRHMLNGVLNTLASYILSRPVPDLTSGFRALKAELAQEFLFLLPNTFSYPTTLTLALMGSGYSVAFCSTPFRRRKGTSKINLFSDGMRFLVIAAKIATLVHPMKVFLPVSAACVAAGLSYYAYTFLTVHRFTNFSLLLMLTGVLVFLMGLIAEQISLLGFDKRRAP